MERKIRGKRVRQRGTHKRFVRRAITMTVSTSGGKRRKEDQGKRGKEGRNPYLHREKSKKLKNRPSPRRIQGGEKGKILFTRKSTPPEKSQKQNLQK